MKIVIPTKDKKLCAHFGNCESFTFVDVNTDNKEITGIEEKIPEDGISCSSAFWIAELGADVILAGGMGGRPLGIFAQNGVRVVAGCPELPIKEIVTAFINNSLQPGENSCGGEHHNCHGHDGHDGSHHGCHGHH